MTKRICLMMFCQLCALCCLMRAQNTSTSSEWKAVEQALGRAGQLQADGAYKFGFPRGDLKVTVDGVKVRPALALGSWAAFSSSGDGSMVMGDLVLAENEVQPVMAGLQEEGLLITALHNHILHETPRVMYMHIEGHGNATKLASSLKKVVALTKTPAAAAPPGVPPVLDLDTGAIDQALGHKGKNNGGVYQVAVPRAEKVTEGGMVILNSMGVATVLNFQPTGAGKAAITGDFVLLGSEVNSVIAALRENGIAVTAVHSHMLQEEPRLFFMHFWASDDALKLAKGLRTALDKTNLQIGK